MKLSVIIPLHNQLALTQAMLASLEETLPSGLEYEIIVIDNASTDGTAAWLEGLGAPRIRPVIHTKNLGYAAANNKGARLARGEFLALLNNDLVLLPGWLEPLLELATLPGVGVAGNIHLSVRSREIDHAGVFFDRSGKPFHFRPPLGALRGASWIEAPAVTGACIILSRSLFRRLHGFDENYVNGYEDIDLCLRAGAQGCRTLVSTRSAAYHYIGMSEGRHAREDMNAARFQRSWGARARELAEISSPSLEEGVGKPGHAGLAFDRNAFATLQAFHPGAGGFSEQASTAHLYPAGRWTNVSIPLPQGVVHGGHVLRLDPCDCPATVRIAAFELRDSKSDKPLWSAAPADLRRLLHVLGTAVAERESAEGVTLTSNGSDPQIRLDPRSIPESLARRLGLTAKLRLMTTVQS